MAASYTFTDLADIIAEYEGRPEGARNTLHRRLRHLLTLGFIEKSVERDARGTAQFDFRNAAKARVGVVLLKLGFDRMRLSAANAVLQRRYVGMNRPAEATGVSNFDVALAGIEAGEAWSLHIAIHCNPNTGKERVSGYCDTDAEPDDPEGKRIAADYRRLTEGEIVEATITIPLTPLLKPLLD